MRLIPKGWQQFQHYKDRCPPWIKLHRDLLNDRAFMTLPVASKALAPLLWLLASESKSETGEFCGDVAELEFRLRISAKEISLGLKCLIDKGFFLDASAVLAERLQVATPETETERETETEKEKPPLPPKGGEVHGFPPGFDAFWSAYPRKTAKPQAAKAFARLRPDEPLLAQMLAALALQSQTDQWQREGGQFIPHASTWINNRRWEDQMPSLAKPQNDPFRGAL